MSVGRSRVRDRMFNVSVVRFGHSEQGARLIVRHVRRGGRREMRSALLVAGGRDDGGGWIMEEGEDGTSPYE